MQIIFILLLLAGCSHDINSTKISLGKFYNLDPSQHKFNQKLTSFQFLLRHAIDQMIDDLSYQDFGCTKDFILDISFRLNNTYSDIQKQKTLDKKICLYKLYYTIYDGDRYYSGKIRAIDSFFIPSSIYPYILSKEDSELGGINHLVKQLDHTITEILHNTCKK
jgi:hypothetical protein